MNIKSIASSSAGNCHIVSSGGFHLLLDCGVPLSRIREALNHDLSKVVGCLVSHEHGDYSKYLKQLNTETNIPIFTTEGTKTARGLNSVHILRHNLPFTIGVQFGCVSFHLSHDVECFGFMIYNRTQVKYQKRLLYITDTGDIGKYEFPEIHYLMIEANHSFQALIDSNKDSGTVKRICETHLSIDQVCEFVERHPDLEEIHLIHLSDGHSDAKEFKRMVQDVSGVPVFIAGK